MIISRLTTKAQTTIPQPVRTALGLHAGDAIAYQIEDGQVVLTRFTANAEKDYPFGTFSEWAARPMNTPIPSFDLWDIVKVPFPHTDRPIRQHRPALVVAAHHSEGGPATKWVFMITSASHRRWAGDIEITDTAMAGLPAPSILRCAKIAIIATAEAQRIGALPLALRPTVSRIVAGTLAALQVTSA